MPIATPFTTKTRTSSCWDVIIFYHSLYGMKDEVEHITRALFSDSGFVFIAHQAEPALKFVESLRRRRDDLMVSTVDLNATVRIDSVNAALDEFVDLCLGVRSIDPDLVDSFRTTCRRQATEFPATSKSLEGKYSIEHAGIDGSNLGSRRKYQLTS